MYLLLLLLFLLLSFPFPEEPLSFHPRCSIYHWSRRFVHSCCPTLKAHYQMVNTNQCVHVCTCVCMCVHVCACICMYMHVCVHRCIRTDVCVLTLSLNHAAKWEIRRPNTECPLNNYDTNSVSSAKCVRDGKSPKRG